MTDFLETSVLVAACAPYHVSYGDARRLLGGEFVTSQRVVTELANVHQRRKRLYGRLISYDPPPGSTAEDLQRKWFHAAAGGHKNDLRHLDELYFVLLEKARLELTSTLRPEDIEVLRREAFKLVNKTKILTGKLCRSFMKDSAYRDAHMVAQTYNNKVRRFRATLLKEMPDAHSHKDDLDILADALCHCVETGGTIRFVTLDTYLVANGGKALLLARKAFSAHPGAMPFETCSPSQVAAAPQLTSVADS